MPIVPSLQNAGFFLVKTFFNFYLILVLLRLIFQMVKADFYNPVSQFILNCTNPLLKPLRKYIPGLFGLDFASLFLLLILQLFELVLLLLIQGSTITINIITCLGAICWCFGSLLDLTISIYFYAVIIFVIFSWFASNNYNYVLLLAAQLIHPLLRFTNKRVKPIGGINLAPLFIIIFLQLIVILLASPLKNFGSYLIYTFK